MKKLTIDDKMKLLAEVNHLLATIPDYQLVMPESGMEYNDIIITDEGYILRIYLEYGEIEDKLLGKTREEAIKSLALNWISIYAEDLFAAKIGWSWEKKYSMFDKIDRFKAYCRSFIYKAEK